MKTLVLSIIIVLLSSFPAQASTVDDVAMLSKKGVGDEVLLALIEKDKANFKVYAKDVVRLKEADVSDAVIVALVKHKGEEPKKIEKPKEDVKKTEQPTVEIIIVKREVVVEAPQSVVVVDPLYVPSFYVGVGIPYCGFGWHGGRHGRR
jgi:hypothetical protein